MTSLIILYVLSALVVVAFVVIWIAFSLIKALRIVMEQVLVREAEVLTSLNKIKMILRFEDQIDAPDIPPDRGLAQRINDYNRIGS